MIDNHLYYGVIVTHRNSRKRSTWYGARFWKFADVPDRVFLVVWYGLRKPPVPFVCDADLVTVAGIPAELPEMPAWAVEPEYV